MPETLALAAAFSGADLRSDARRVPSRSEGPISQAHWGACLGFQVIRSSAIWIAMLVL